MTDPNITARDREAELLPCPFCGAKDESLLQAYTRATDTFEYWSVECLDCACEIASDLSQDEANTQWNTRATISSAELKTWANYHGPLPDYDHPLRPVYESGIQYAVELLAKMLNVDDWEICDGTEEFDGDLGGTLFNIVLAAMPKNADGDPIFPSELPARLEAESRVKALEEEKGWLVEFLPTGDRYEGGKRVGPATPLQYYGISTNSWGNFSTRTDDPNKAMRFARQEDAAWQMAYLQHHSLGILQARVCEHSWHPLPARTALEQHKEQG